MYKASLARRLGALLYDTLASIAILMLTTACWLPMYGGEAVPPGNLWYQASLVGVLYLYFAYCWHRGQTVGMRAWRIRITHVDGGPVSWAQSAVRFVTAPIGICGMLLGWPLHDRWSKTKILCNL